MPTPTGPTPNPNPLPQPKKDPKLMALNPIADAVVRMEGADLPNSVNMHMVRKYGLWNVGHLIWWEPTGQYGATKVWIGDRYWAGWPSREDAYAGLLRDLAAKARAGMTIEQAFRKYAPPKENNTEAYIQYVVDQTGWPRTTPLKSILAGTVTPVVGNSPAEALSLDNADTDNPEAPIILEDGSVAGGGDLFGTMSEDNKILLMAAAGAGLLFMALTRM